MEIRSEAIRAKVRLKKRKEFLAKLKRLSADWDSDMDPMDTYERSGVLFRVKNVKIIKEGTIPPKDQDFRFQGDGDHIVRRLFSSPLGYTRIFRDIPLKGICFQGRAVVCDIFIHGKDGRLVLKTCRAANNTQGVRVVGYWKDGLGGENNGELGWLPADIASSIITQYPSVPVVAKPVLMFQSRPGLSPGMRLDIYKPYEGRN